MKFNFDYEVDHIDAKDEIEVIQASITEELNEEQTECLIASYRTGKFEYLNEDETIADIYKQISDMAREIEKDFISENIKFEVRDFEYPYELNDMVANN